MSLRNLLVNWREAWQCLAVKFWLVALLIGVSPCFADFAAWRLLHFPETVAAPTKELTVWGDEADPDNDLYANLQEYAQDADPNVSSEPIEWAFVDEYGERHLFLTFPYQVADPPLATVIESSSDAKQWAPASVFSPRLEVPITSSTRLVNRVSQGSMESISVRTTALIEDTDRLFLRTRVMPEEEALLSPLAAEEFLIEDGLLTDPLLQNPTSSSVIVV